MHHNCDIEIRIARSLGEIEKLRQFWSAWPGHRDADIDMVITVVASYPEAIRPHVIVIYHLGSPDAILIGRLERKRIPFRAGYFILFRPWARCLTFVYGAIRGNATAANTQMLVREVFNCLKQGEADMAIFEHVPTKSALYQFALSVPGTFSRDRFPLPQGHELMHVPDSIDRVWSRMSGPRRKHLRANYRKLQAHPAGPLRTARYQGTCDLDGLFHDAEQIAAKTYQRGLHVGFADTPVVRKRLALAAQKGWLRSHVLYLGERPIAFWIGMLYQGTFVSEYMGYDPEFRSYGPGMVLIMQVIEWFCSRGNQDHVDVIDFGIGDAEYKALLGTDRWVEANTLVLSPSLKGFSLKCMRVTTRLLDLFARKLLSSAHLFPRLKRVWRDRLAKAAQSSTPSPPHYVQRVHPQ
jgi:hypothetical protein